MPVSALSDAPTGTRTARVAPAADRVGPEATRPTLRIVAAHPDPIARDFYRANLPRYGHEVLVVATGPELVKACGLLTPDLILAATRLPGLDGLAAVEAICRERPVPVVLTADSFDPPAVARAAASDWVMGCLPWPAPEGAVAAAVTVAVRRFAQVETLRAEVAELRQALDERKEIERAKGLVTRYGGLSEEVAYNRLRALASRENRKLVDVARSVISAAQIFRALEQEDEAAGRRAGMARRDGPPACTPEIPPDLNSYTLPPTSPLRK